MERKKRHQPAHRPGFEIDYNDFKNSADIQKFINRQLWLAGGTINTSNGGPIQNTIKWGGQSRFLCGFNFFAPTVLAHTISVILNQETIIDQVPLIFLNPNSSAGNMKFQQYFEFIRPLSGSDVMIFSIQSTVAEQLNYGIYMTRAYNKYYTRE